MAEPSSPPPPYSPRAASSSASRQQSSLRPGVVATGRMEDTFDILADYKRRLAEDETKSMPIAAIEALVAFSDVVDAGTIHEFVEKVALAEASLVSAIPNPISLSAGTELYKKLIISHTHKDPKDYEAFRNTLRGIGKEFAVRARVAREGAADTAKKVIREGMTVYTHGYSRCVMATFRRAREEGKNFKVIVSETSPSMDGLRTAKELRGVGVEVAVVNDNAVAYALYRCRVVLLGAEAILGDGGIINTLGSLNVALAANRFKSRHKLYIIAESLKFVDLWASSFQQAPDHRAPGSPDRFAQNLVVFDPPGIDAAMPQEEQRFFDYVPKEYIHGFLTEIGVLTPEEVGDSVVAMRFK